MHQYHIFIYHLLYIYMSQAQKSGSERDEEVWSFHSIWGSSVDASRCAEEPW